MLFQAEPLQPSVDLQHFGEVDGCLLPYGLIQRVVDIQNFEAAVVPI